MTDTAIIKNFLLAGRARVTLVSKKTGVRYTYRIKKAKNKPVDRWYVSLLTGQDNESAFTYMGAFEYTLNMSLGRDVRFHNHAESVVAFRYFLHHLHSNSVPAKLEVWHEGKCGRCGRALTVPESIERGIGPECAGIQSKARRRDGVGTQIDVVKDLEQEDYFMRQIQARDAQEEQARMDYKYARETT
jgi:hypothetical protein